MLKMGVHQGAATLAVCAVFLLSPIGETHARDGLREDARALASGQKSQAPNGKAAKAGRSASTAEEPFCVRPFEYPKGRR